MERWGLEEGKAGGAPPGARGCSWPPKSVQMAVRAELPLIRGVLTRGHLEQLRDKIPVVHDANLKQKELTLLPCLCWLFHGQGQLSSCGHQPLGREFAAHWPLGNMAQMDRTGVESREVVEACCIVGWERHLPCYTADLGVIVDGPAGSATGSMAVGVFTSLTSCIFIHPSLCPHHPLLSSPVLGWPLCSGTLIQLPVNLLSLGSYPRFISENGRTVQCWSRRHASGGSPTVPGASDPKLLYQMAHRRATSHDSPRVPFLAWVTRHPGLPGLSWFQQ